MVRVGAALAAALWMGTSATLTREAWAGAGSAAAPFLKFPMGARSAAMGEAFVGVTGDAQAGAWNPAAFASVRRHDLTLQHIVWFEDVAYDSLIYGMPRCGEKWGFGLQGGLVRSGDMDVIREIPGGTMGVPVMTTDKFTTSDLLVALSAAYQVKPDLSVGVSAKFIDDKVYTDHASAFAGDVGALWMKEKMSLGLAVQNLGTKVKDDKLPLIVRVGGAQQIGSEGLATLEVDYPLDQKQIRAGIGAEYWFFNLIAPRAGFVWGPKGDIGARTYRVGGGLKHEFDGLSLLVDYAYLPGGDLGQAHRISLSARFGKDTASRAEARATAPAAPAGLRAGASPAPTQTALTPEQQMARKREVFGQAQTAYQSGNYDEAITKWEDVLKIDPNHGPSMSGLERARVAKAAAEPGKTP